MKLRAALILLPVLATGPVIPPASADTSDGTKNWRHNANHANHAPASAGKLPTCKSIYQDWSHCSQNRDGTIANTPGIALTASELKSQLDANKAYNAQMVRRIIDAGGINADEQPVALASHPMVHFEAFGEGQQMGSND